MGLTGPRMRLFLVSPQRKWIGSTLPKWEITRLLVDCLCSLGMLM